MTHRRGQVILVVGEIMRQVNPLTSFLSHWLALHRDKPRHLASSFRGGGRESYAVLSCVSLFTKKQKGDREKKSK